MLISSSVRGNALFLPVVLAAFAFLEKALEIKQKAEYVICMQNNDILSHSRTESNF
jgi:hypothetical protein